MYNILFIINTSNYTHHSSLLSILKNNFCTKETTIDIIDICKSDIATLCNQLSTTKSDIIVTLDLAGFEIKTLTGECLLNMLPCKVCNILWGDKPEYSTYLNGKLSLSMLFYDATGIDHQLSAKYPYMRYYYPTSMAIATTQTGNTESNLQTLEVLQNTWNHFKKEVLL